MGQKTGVKSGTERGRWNKGNGNAVLEEAKAHKS